MNTLLKQGINHFNRREFFNAHEVWEEFYRVTEVANRPFVEGLVQLAAAFRLFQDFAEIQGPVRMIYQALIRMENFQPEFLQVRVQELHQAAESWARIAEAQDRNVPLPSPPQIVIRRSKFFS